MQTSSDHLTPRNVALLGGDDEAAAAAAYGGMSRRMSQTGGRSGIVSFVGPDE